MRQSDKLVEEAVSAEVPEDGVVILALIREQGKKCEVSLGGKTLPVRLLPSGGLEVYFSLEKQDGEKVERLVVSNSSARSKSYRLPLGDLLPSQLRLLPKPVSPPD